MLLLGAGCYPDPMRLFRRISVAPLAVLLLSGVTQAGGARAEAPVSTRHAAAIERGRALLHAIVDASGSPGLSVAVAVKGKIVWAEGFGYADLENRLPVTSLTKFRIGSVSKRGVSALRTADRWL